MLVTTMRVLFKHENLFVLSLLRHNLEPKRAENRDEKCWVVQLKYIGEKKGEYFRFYNANSERVSSLVLSELLKPC